MRSKIVFRGQSEKLFSEVFEDFIASQTARGISDITIRNYLIKKEDFQVLFQNILIFPLPLKMYPKDNLMK